MARLTPKTDVLRALFARSGNQCAFPGCTHILIDEDNQFIAQVCHIEAALTGGERYNPNMSDEQRRSYENLVIFCYPHHIKTDDVNKYPVERLSQIKRDHEQQFLKSDFKIDETELYKISCEIEQYWLDIERLNKVDHVFIDSGLAMKIEGNDDFFEISKNANEFVSDIENILELLHKSDESLISDFESLLCLKDVNVEMFNDIPYFKNPLYNKNWELHNIGLPNLLKQLRISLVHLKVKYLEEYMKVHSDDIQAKMVFDKAKEELKEYAKTAMCND